MKFLLKEHLNFNANFSEILFMLVPTYFSMKIELNTFEKAKTLRYILIMLLQKGSDLIVPVSVGL